MARSDGVSSRNVEPWRRMLTDNSEKIVGEVKWNDHLLTVCQGRVLPTTQIDQIRGRHIQYRGHKFLKFLKEKSQEEFLEFANILACKGYKELAQEMKNMIHTPADLKKKIKEDVEERVETSLRGSRISENKKQTLTVKVADYVQAKAYEWQKYTDTLRSTIDTVNEDIEDMCAKVVEKAKVLDVPLPADQPPIKQLDTCVKTIAETCGQLHQEMQRLQQREEEYKIERRKLNHIIETSVNEVEGQKEHLQKTIAELNRIKEELERVKHRDQARVKLIEELKKQVKIGARDVDMNMEKLKQLQKLEQKMSETELGVSAMKETMRRKNKKIAELEDELEQSHLEIDHLKAKLKYHQEN